MSYVTRHMGTRNVMNDDVFDYSATLDRLGGDAELFTDLVRFFLEDVDGLVARLHDALDQRDARRVEMAAHALKGLCANFSARRAVEAAATAEEAARDGRTPLAEIDAHEVDEAVAELKSALARRLVSQQHN